MLRVRAIVGASIVVAAVVVLAFGCGEVEDSSADAADAAPDGRDSSVVSSDAPVAVREDGTAPNDGGGDGGSAFDGGGDGGGGDGGGDGGDGGDGGVRPKLGVCASEAECGPNGRCVEIVAGGYRTCLF